MKLFRKIKNFFVNRKEAQDSAPSSFKDFPNDDLDSDFFCPRTQPTSPGALDSLPEKHKTKDTK